MDKNTLSNYGWIVIAVLVLSVMIALATPFGNFIKLGIESTTAGLFNTSESALNVVGMSAKNDDNGDSKDEMGTDNNSGTSTPTIDHNGTRIPEGATYTQADGTVLNAGDEFPSTVNDGDIYVYDDYEYKYNFCYSGSNWITPGASYKVTSTTLNGWGVRVLNTNKTEYGAILESINSKPITNMDNTFSACYDLTTAPAIPNNVTSMMYTFTHCTSLTTAPDMSNANNLTNMTRTFYGCTALSNASEDIVIPSNVENMTHTFSECKNLTIAPAIPNNVTNMEGTFYECNSLTDISNLIIPDNVTSLLYTFAKCNSLTDISNLIIPDGVTNMSSAFWNCISLTSVPTIPSSVTHMVSTFMGCTSLTGNVTINANPTYYETSFRNVDFTAQNLTLVGNSTKLDTLGATGKNYCKTCNGVCNNSH